jgi:hypothetical protein
MLMQAASRSVAAAPAAAAAAAAVARVAQYGTTEATITTGTAQGVAA